MLIYTYYIFFHASKIYYEHIWLYINTRIVKIRIEYLHWAAK